jgi:hypothetical protein
MATTPVKIAAVAGLAFFMAGMVAGVLAIALVFGG